MADKFNQTVCDIIFGLFRDIELPYRIDRWNVKGRYKGLGLFATKLTKHSSIVKATNGEESNAELLWLSTTGERHDCVFESTWSEDAAVARASGWWWKQHFLDKSRYHTEDERVWLKARFAIRGRLMFGNHKPDAPFHFSQLTRHSPRHHTARVIGKVSYRAKDPDKIVKKGQQTWVYYGEGVDFELRQDTEYVADHECRLLRSN